jgi:hypothetical protein
MARGRAGAESRPAPRASAMSSGVSISLLDGPVRERMRDLLALHVIRGELAPLRLAICLGKVDRALDVLLAANAARDGVLNAFEMPRPALAHQLRHVLAEASQIA